MIDREKGMSWLEGLAQPDWHEFHSDTEVQVIAESALDLLKEQEDLGTELTNAVELIHKKNERIEKLLKEQEAVEPTIDEYGNKRCGSCGHKLQSIADPDLFCCKCGKPVLWEGR